LPVDWWLLINPFCGNFVRTLWLWCSQTMFCNYWILQSTSCLTYRLWHRL